MTVTAYMFDYTLNIICSGNKSECARKLGIRRTDLNRMEHRFAEGATSVRAIEAILLLFWHEHYSLDEALKGYISVNPQEFAGDDRTDAPEHAIRLLRDELTREWKSADARKNLYKSAESFLAQLEHCFCTEECRNQRDCKTDCPCRRFVSLVTELRQELDQFQN